MKVNEIKELVIYIAKEENDNLKIIEDKEFINFDNLKKYVQLFNIKNIIGVGEINFYKDLYEFTVKAEVQ